jgi:peptide/nickel transport system substrate-binding protein
MFKKRLTLLLGLLIAVSLVLGACGPAAVDTPPDVDVPPDVPVVPGEEPEVPRTTRTGGWLDTIVILQEADYNKAFPRLESGEFGLYMFSTADPDFKAKVEDSDQTQYGISFGSSREITFNPAGPIFEGTGKLNPFAVPRIREAMNWLIDREYIAEELYRGTVVPRWTVIPTSSPDYGKMADLARKIEATYAYDKDQAAAVIGEEMEALGASLVNGVWTYEGEPVEINFIIRVEWGRPQGDYLANQLEDIGFTVVRDYKNAAEAAPLWLSGNPNDGAWHIYTGGWGATGLSRDVCWAPGYFHTNFGRADALWQAYNPPADFYDAADVLWNGTFESLQEREELCRFVLEGAIQDSVRIWLFDEAGFTAFRSEVEVSVDLAAGVVGSRLWPFTLRYSDREGGSMTVAMPSILTQPMNPPDGSNWTYDQAISRATGDDMIMLDPFTGLAWPQRIERAEIVVKEGLPVGVTHDWLTLSFAPEIAVPEDAWADWDAENQVFLTVGELHPEGLTAQQKQTIYFPADLYDTVKWHDGSAFSIGDVLMKMILTFDRAKEGSAIYDEAKAPAFRSFMGAFRGVRIVSVDPLVIETWSDSIDMDAELMLYNWWPYYPQGQGAWHNLTLGILAEEKLLATFTDAKANANSVDRVNYLAGPTVAILNDQLVEAMAENYLPYAPTFSQFVTEDEAASRYENLAEWYRVRGHFWIGTGVYYIEKAFPVEKMVVLQRFTAFPDLADKWARFSAPPIAVVEVDGPDRVTIGAEATFDVYITYQDAAYPTADIDTVTFLLFDATGQLTLVGPAEVVEDGLWRVVLTAEQTNALAAGAGKIEVVVISKTVALPSFDALQFVVAP